MQNHNRILLSVIDVCEGLHISMAVQHLYKYKILTYICEPKTIKQISHHTGLLSGPLQSILDYASERTDFVQRDGDCYVLKQPIESLSYFLSQYLGAYGPCSLDLDKVLKIPESAKSLVDRVAHSHAFSGQPEPTIVQLSQLIDGFKCQNLLELGCGTASMLIDLAQKNPDFHGVGVDFSSNMCAVAEKRIKALGLDDRIKIHCIDVSNMGDLVNYGIACENIQGVSMTSLLNEFFLPNCKGAIDCLKQLALQLPGRITFIADYYGRLGHDYGSGGTHCLLHDYVQAISGQGIPPPSLEGWQYVYNEANCTLIHAYEAEGDMPFFIHMLQLGSVD